MHLGHDHSLYQVSIGLLFGRLYSTNKLIGAHVEIRQPHSTSTLNKHPIKHRVMYLPVMAEPRLILTLVKEDRAYYAPQIV